jgi:hypothetical protein
VALPPVPDYTELTLPGLGHLAAHCTESLVSEDEAARALLLNCAYKKTADSGEKGRGRVIDTPFSPKDVDCKGFEPEDADLEMSRCRVTVDHRKVLRFYA